MSGKPLDAIGVTGEVGKHDFVLTGEKEIVHGPGGPDGVAVALKRRTPESEARYYSEKIAELVLAQSELRKVVEERDALAQELQEVKRIAQTYNQPDRRDSWKWLNEVGDIAAKALARLEAGKPRFSRS